MSAREWKPGDVGMSKYGRVFYTEDGWFFDDGSGGKGAITIETGDPSGLRPLLVIDPENRVEVERVRDALLSAFREQNDLPMRVSAGVVGNAMQAALRSIITPPKPEEPTGLGAVVEDAEGKRWIRAARIRHGWHRPMGTWATYADIDAVKTLSEGVQ